MFVRTATCGRKRSTASSWNEDTSQTKSRPPGSRRKPESGVPMFPASATGRPARCRISAIQARRRGLAVGAGDRDPAVRPGRLRLGDAPGDLDLGEDRDAALARRGHDRRVERHAGRDREPSRAVEKLLLGSGKKRSARAPEGLDALQVRRPPGRRPPRPTRRARAAPPPARGRCAPGPARRSAVEARRAGSRPCSSAARSSQLQGREAHDREEDREDPEPDDDARLGPAREARSDGGAAPSGRRACRST